MSPTLADIRNREPVDLTPGVTTKLKFDGVLVIEVGTGREVFVTGPVDLLKYDRVEFSGTTPATGESWHRKGIGFHAYQMDGQPVDRFYRAVGVRFLENMKADLASGSYMTTEYEITPVGDPPSTRYQVVRRSMVPSVSTSPSVSP